MTIGAAGRRNLDPGPVGLTKDDLPPIPDALPPHTGPGPNPALRFDPRTLFTGRAAQPLEIEIGSGKGAFLIEEAAKHPDVNFLGFEWAREYWLYAADRLRRRGLKNVRLLHADAVEFLRHRAPDAVAQAIHLYFSDPWPKKKHHKRRVVQDAFLTDAHRVLTPAGELRIVTDHEDYWAWMEERFARWCDPAKDGPRFERLPFGAEHRPGSARAGELVGTNFERKYAQEGRPFHAAVLRKV